MKKYEREGLEKELLVALKCVTQNNIGLQNTVQGYAIESKKAFELLHAQTETEKRMARVEHNILQIGAVVDATRKGLSELIVLLRTTREPRPRRKRPSR